MQAAGAEALLTKSSPDKATAKPSPRHGARRHADTPFHAVLGKALGAKPKAEPAGSASTRERLAALAAVHEALKEAFPAIAARAAHPETKAGKARHGENLPHPFAAAAVLLKEGESERPAEPGKHVGKNEKKTVHDTRHADGLDAGWLSIASALPTGVNGSPGPRQDRAAPPAPKSAAEHVGTAAAGARTGHEIRVHVLDLRKKTADGPAGDSTATANVARPAAAERDLFAPVLTREAPAQTATHETHRPAPVVASPFAGALERLRDMAGSELTRAAGIVLRDGGGEIKLVLKPESLGSVRIRMNLVDNAIEGRIIVDNPAVKHVFDASLDSLMRALTAEGFQTTSLQVAVGGQNGNSGRQEREATPRIRRVAAQGFEGNVPGVESMSLGELLVNLFV